MFSSSLLSLFLSVLTVSILIANSTPQPSTEPSSEPTLQPTNISSPEPSIEPTNEPTSAQTSTTPGKNSDFFSKIMIIGIAAGGGVLLVLLVLGFIFRDKIKKLKQCCSRRKARELNHRISFELLAEKRHAGNVHKLLFLGSGGSGKSTFFKQMSLIHGDGFNTDDRSGFHIDICGQILEQMDQMIDCISVINLTLAENYQKELELSPQAEKSATFIQELSLAEIIDEEIAHHLKTLWREEAIQTVYQNRAALQIDDSVKFFLDDIDRIGDQDHYIPSDDDIIAVRHRTTGVTSKKFLVDDTQINLFDVGGQKSERKKWIHCFENVTAVIFVASLSSYDELLYEDSNENCMHDSIELFKEILENQWFINTPIILFLNKNDLFIEKIQHVPLKECFPEFKFQQNENYHDELKYDDAEHDDYEAEVLRHDDAYEQCLEFLRKKYIGLNTNEKRNIYAHVTTATNKENVTRVFSAVTDTIIQATAQQFQLYIIE